MKQITISELISKLEKIQAEHGNLPVWITGEWNEPMRDWHLEVAEPYGDRPKCVGLDVG